MGLGAQCGPGFAMFELVPGGNVLTPISQMGKVGLGDVTHPRFPSYQEEWLSFESNLWGPGSTYLTSLRTPIGTMGGLWSTCPWG